MKESGFWSLLKKHLRGHATRVENGVSAGIPDVDCCWNGQSRKIELKIMHGNRIEIRWSQLIWWRLRAREQGSSCVVLLAKRERDGAVLGWRVDTLLERLGSLTSVTPNVWRPDLELRFDDKKKSFTCNPGVPDFATTNNWAALNNWIYE